MKKQIAPGITLGFHHYHAGNDPRGVMRKRSAYATVAVVKNENTGVILATGIARCNAKDKPSRKTGRAIAEGRAIKAYVTSLDDGPKGLPQHG